MVGRNVVKSIDQTLASFLLDSNCERERILIDPLFEIRRTLDQLEGRGTWYSIQLKLLRFLLLLLPLLRSGRDHQDLEDLKQLVPLLLLRRIDQ